VAPDRVSTISYGSYSLFNPGFPGTSASAPHVAGAAALAKEANPSFSWADIKAFLESRAVDLGMNGRDNVYGAGRLTLGTPPSITPAPTPTRTPSGTQASTSLAAGWNHVCYIGAEQPVREALGDIAGSVQALYRIESGGALDRWFPGRPEVSTITALAPEDSLLMLMAAPAAWNQTGVGAAPDVTDMAQGWSSICFEGGAQDIEDAVEGIDGQVTIIYALAPGQGWLRFVPGRSDISSLDRVEPHQALLVLVDDPGGAVWHFGAGEIPLPPLTPLDQSLQAKAHEVRDAMSSIRGLPVNSDIEEGTISQAALTDYYEQVAEQTRQEDAEHWEALNLVFRLLHLIGPEDDLLAINTEFSSNILGFYVPSEDKLALVAEQAAAIDVEGEGTLAHEYVHSFQDARFDIEKLQGLAEDEDESHSNTEYGTTVECLLEGDATVSEVAYLVTTHPDDWLLSMMPSPEGESDSSDIPPGMIRYYYFPYDQCADFVSVLLIGGGWEAVNKTYDDVPTSTEQVLHPEKYFSHEAPAAVSLTDISAQLGATWKQQDDAVFGEFDVYNYLLTSLEGQPEWDSVAQEAAAGWGGGRMASYTSEDGAHVVLQLSLQWDSAGDLSEFVAAFLQVAGATAGQWWPADPGMTAVRWDAASEHGFATWQGGSFTALLSASADDLGAATTAAGYDLDAAVGPSLSAPPQ